MDTPAPRLPLRFDPSVGRRAEDEADIGAALAEAMRGVQETTFKD